MTIYDRARDALNICHDRTRSRDEFCKAADELAAISGDTAAEVVRLHDELSALADELDASGERRRFDASPYEQAAGVAQVVDAARIREVIEGEA